MKLASTAFKYDIEQNAHTVQCDLRVRFWCKQASDLAGRAIYAGPFIANISDNAFPLISY